MDFAPKSQALAELRGSGHSVHLSTSSLFSKMMLQRKDFQEITRLAWAQEAPGSNPGAPTKISSPVSNAEPNGGSPQRHRWETNRQECWCCIWFTARRLDHSGFRA
jgi:hypothetical protein